MASSNESPDYTYAHAHGTVMVLAWMLFAPTGIFFARYGRFLHIGIRRKILGEMLWFQAHRLALSVAALATLLGFFLILVQTKSTWVDVNTGGKLFYAHSIMGVLIVCFSMTQVWMALFRCHPESKFRFIYNWMHRITGIAAFILSTPTIFVVTYGLPYNHNGFVAILSIWTAWVVIIMVIFEVLHHGWKPARQPSKTQYKIRQTASGLPGTDQQQNEGTIVESEELDNNTVNKMKFILLSVHVIVSIALAIALIVLIWSDG
ncbi:unnamed protein product [Adineta steineri]|uniref:Cytochrome b561 domain-containing protein n=1 Tax=Adineta steineri TaxID=433720 RepID=A0A815MWE5_9BILA|nr:unnamed protein product [Adineta steineri]